MYLRSFYLEDTGCASYMVGCPATRQCAVVDPLADLTREYLLEAADRGLKITHIVDTHIHADHVSGARELARRTEAPIYMHADAGVTYDIERVADGDVLDVGNVQLKVMHTPGHTPESISLLVSDTPRTEEPWFILTGDTLFVGDVGRPDLLLGEAGEESSDERARRLYDSLHRLIDTLPDTVEIYPGHYGGSACGGKHMSGKPMSTIGFERRFNHALQQSDPESFAQFVRETAKPFPENYQTIKRKNMGQEAA